MEFSPVVHSAPHLRNHVLLLSITFSLWIYVICCCVAFSAPNLPNRPLHPVHIYEREAKPRGGAGSVGASGFLLNNVSDLNASGNESRKFPQAIIIGVKKGGTRALLEALRLHPDIRAAGAEPHFFDRNYDKGLDWYRELMPASVEGQLTMEKTPSYFVTADVPARIYNMSQQTKLIVVVRDPVTRAISDYTQTRSKKPAIASFESLTFKNASAGLIDVAWSAVRIGMYAKHLEHWLRFFPLQQLLFVSGERLVSEPSAELARVQDFLGLQRAVTYKHFLFDPAKGFPCLRPRHTKPHCLGKSKGRAHPRVPPPVLLQLRRFYKPHNLRFYQMTGHNFGWD